MCCIVHPACLFLLEFSDFLSSTMKLSRLLTVVYIECITYILIIHIDDDANPFARGFISIMDSFHFSQHVSSPTQSKGHTQDRVFTLGLNIVSIYSENIFISVQHPILFDLS